MMGDYSRANEPKEQRMTDSERLENMLCIVFEIRTAFDLNDADRKQQYGSRGPKLLVCCEIELLSSHAFFPPA